MSEASGWKVIVGENPARVEQYSPRNERGKSHTVYLGGKYFASDSWTGVIVAALLYWGGAIVKETSVNRADVSPEDLATKLQEAVSAGKQITPALMAELTKGEVQVVLTPKNYKASVKDIDTGASYTIGGPDSFRPGEDRRPVAVTAPETEPVPIDSEPEMIVVPDSGDDPFARLQSRARS